MEPFVVSSASSPRSPSVRMLPFIDSARTPESPGVRTVTFVLGGLVRMRPRPGSFTRTFTCPDESRSATSVAPCTAARWLSESERLSERSPTTTVTCINFRESSRTTVIDPFSTSTSSDFGSSRVVCSVRSRASSCDAVGFAGAAAAGAAPRPEVDTETHATLAAIDTVATAAVARRAAGDGRY